MQATLNVYNHVCRLTDLPSSTASATKKAFRQGCLSTKSSGQSYKASMIVIYDSRVIPDLKIPHIMTLEL